MTDNGRSTDETNSSVTTFLTVADLPHALQPLRRRLDRVSPEELIRFAPPAGEAPRQSAVLVLFGEDSGEADVLIIERSAQLRSHAGQPAFPGGAVEPEDLNAIGTALRESQEETGLDPAGVAPFATLPHMWLPPSGFVVTPVLGWWRHPSPVWPADPAEVAGVHRVLVSDLVNPSNRVQVSHPSGYRGPGFMVNGMLVWGFTAMLLDWILALGGWEQQWEHQARTVPFDSGWQPR